MLLTRYVSVTALQGMKVVHEFFHRDLEGLEQAGVFKEAVRDLKQKKKKKKNHISATNLNSPTQTREVLFVLGVEPTPGWECCH